MKKITFYFLFLSVLPSCHESKESDSNNHLAVFNRQVGQQISLETAQRWIARFSKLHDAARINAGHQLSETSLNEMLNPTNEKVGISFHRAIDDEGTYHIIVEPIIEGQSAWASQVMLDANTDAPINAETAQRWTDRYKAANLNGTWSHFFGMHVFESAFSTIDLVEALDDENEHALLLYIWRKSSIESGRSNAEMLEVFDKSSPCPPICHDAI